MTRATLTAEAIAWIAQHTDSLVARVALMGYDQGWPTAHVTTAIHACNKAAATA